MFESIAATDPATRGISERATELLYLAEDLGMEVRSYRDSIDADPARLTVVEERLAEIRQLQRKYGTSIADILEHARVAEEELERQTGSEVDTEPWRHGRMPSRARLGSWPRSCSKAIGRRRVARR